MAEIVQFTPFGPEALHLVFRLSGRVQDGALPTSHMTIRRIIVDRKATGPVINGQGHDANGLATPSHLSDTAQRSLIGDEQAVGPGEGALR